MQWEKTMTIGTAGRSFALRMDQFSLEEVATGTIVSATPTNIRVAHSNDPGFHNFGGNFTFSGGNVSGGTLTSVRETLGGQTVVSITGFSVNALTVLDWIRTNNTEAALATLLAGNDRITGSNKRDYLFALGGNDTLFGLGDNDTIFGGDGNDTLDVGRENDRLSEGAGNDRLLGGQGNDRLGGGQGDDRLSGGSGNDNLTGNAGDDTLIGGTGIDRLTGGDGSDLFLFNTRASRTNYDVITGFNVTLDTIGIENAVFTRAGGNGTLAAGAFWKSASGRAHDASDRFIYDTNGGQLYYDADGSGSGAPVKIAQLKAGLALTHDDIIVF